MKKFFWVLILINLLFALDKTALINMVKSNPMILDTPQGQMALKKYGLTKEQVLSMIKKEKNQKVTPVNVQNKIQNFEQNQSKINNEINSSKKKQKVIKNPLVYIDPYDLIKQIQKDQQIQKKVKLKRYGEKFFYNKNTLNKNILAVPDYYQLNPGDIVIVQIFGGEDKTLTLTVDNNGNITLPVIGPIYVAGLTVSEVKDLIKRKLEPTYPNSRIVVDVKVNSFIQVALTGYVPAPGIYNLSSLSTVKDLLIAANGFGDIGSMRRVYLKRDGKVLKIIDFYELIKNGKLVDTTLLRNGDIIYVPKAKILVKLSGAVATPAIYEMKKYETLKDLINYSGGLLPYASSKDIKITRYINNSYTKVFFKNLNSNFRFLNGDDVYVYKISELNQDYVIVEGNVEKPGSYEIPKDRKLSTLLKKITLLKDTYYPYGLIERFKGELVSFDLRNPGDIKLEKKDKIYIFNKYQVVLDEYVKVGGDVVANPGKLRFIKGMTLKDAILNAGLKENFDKNKVKITRYDELMQPKTFFVDYEKNASLKLQPFDEITLYKYTDFNPLKPVIVMGEVNSPNIYTYSDGLKLKDVIDIAGGFTDKADKNHIELIRYYIENGIRKRKVIKLSFNKDKDFLIKPYDEINVKVIPNWGERKVVILKGEVKYPGVYVIKTGEKLASVIKRAGGFTKNAYLYAAVFTRESVRKMQEKRLKNMIYTLKKKIAIIAASAKGAGQSAMDARSLIEAIDNVAKQAEKLKPIGRIAIKLDRNLTKFEKSPYNITLKDKDTLYVPSKKDSVIVMGEVLTPTAFVYTTDSALKYIKKAGGRTSLADDIYFVVHANGFTEKGEFGSWFDDDIKVKPGDAITVPILIKTATWYGIAKDISAIVYQLAITAASLKTVGVFK